MIDAGGKLVLPGFNDAHVHFFSGGENLAGVHLRDAKSEDEFRRRIAEFAAKQPAGRWITGGGWDHENWTPARLPTRQLIDDASAGHPVFVNRLDGHMALANSQALHLAGITRDTPDPPGGTIVRDAAGEPTGVLKDAAMGRVDRVVPDPSADQIADAVRAAMRYAAENGVTSVQDMSAAPEILRVYQTLLARGELTVRISGHQPLAPMAAPRGRRPACGFRRREAAHRGVEGFRGWLAGVDHRAVLRALPGCAEYVGAGEQPDDPGKQDAG